MFSYISSFFHKILHFILLIIDYLIEFIGFDVKNNKKVIMSTIILIVLLLIYRLVKSVYYYKFSKENDSEATSCLTNQNEMIWDLNQQPLMMQKDEILEHTLKEFRIASSHNTYIPCNQNMDIASKLSIRNALLLGCRVVELDLFIDTSDNNPLIVHGVEGSTVEKDIYTTSTLNFKEACEEINNYAFKKTNDPLIITLELNTHKNDEVNTNTANILREIFGDRLLAKDETKSIGDYTLRELMGKVILLSGGGSSGELKNVLNNTWYDDKLQNISSNTEITDEIINFNKTGITRVYPAGDVSGHFSGNFDPKKFWDAGCQIVAMNYQTNDTGMLDNNGMFKNSSFILKSN